MINPYASPAPQRASHAVAPRICIDYFQISDGGFLCTDLSRAEVVESLRQQMIRCCTELGFQVVTEQPDYRITGQLLWVEEGSRFLRMLAPGLLGAASVQAVCQLMREGEMVQEIRLHKRRSAGFQGGNSRALIEHCLQQIALRVASDAAIASGLAATAESAGATSFLGGLATVAAFGSLGLGWLAYRWAMTVPLRRDGLSDSAKPIWACIVALLIFAVLCLFGLASAPNSVLKSRLLLWLRSASGVQSLLTQRLVLALLAAAPLGLLFMCYMVL